MGAMARSGHTAQYHTCRNTVSQQDREAKKQLVLVQLDLPSCNLRSSSCAESCIT